MVNNKKRVALHNLGCKVNAYEMEAMEQELADAGYEIVPFEPGADVYIINTCTVTNIADRKSRQMLHKARKMNPEAIVIAAGCYVQAQKNENEIDNAIDIVLGNNRKQELINILENYRRDQGQKKILKDLEKPVEYENMTLSAPAEHTRAYLKVQDGCDQFCSYCIIPYVRGRVRSRKKEEVLNEVNRLTENGYQEFVLTGIHLSSYGKDIGESLLGLIEAVHQAEGVKRIRLGSLEPRIVTEEFGKALGSMTKICPHFHLSLQSGCDETLKRMNRKYTGEEYMEGCRILRKYFKDPALTTDIITGFPGETEEDFTELSEFVHEIRFDRLGCFAYSQEEDTPAALLAAQIDEETKNRRAEIIMEQQMEIKQQKGEEMVGKAVTVLTEGFDRYAECYFGRTAADSPDIDGKVFFTAQGNKPYFGQFVKVRIDDCMDCDLTGERI